MGVNIDCTPKWSVKMSAKINKTNSTNYILTLNNINTQNKLNKICVN